MDVISLFFILLYSEYIFRNLGLCQSSKMHNLKDVQFQIQYQYIICWLWVTVVNEYSAIGNYP